MTEVKVLIEGYAKEMKKGWLASSTVTLVKSDNKKIIVDPGCNRSLLLKSLKDNNLSVDDIDFILLTHGHVDHALLGGTFEKAKIVTFENLMYDKDLQVEFDKNILGKETEIINTPGHCSEHISLIVNASKGKHVIAGDVFWWSENEEQKVDVNKEDDAHPSETDMKKLKESRKKILEIADYIIPGHGKMFKVNKK
jgi:glyoxylase-like metal-dependent hydrolase (beta-lactamase superfamily II)